MKKALLLVLALSMVMTASLALAQGGAVVMYGDAVFTQCNVTNAAGLMTAYVVHELHPGASAVQYMIQNNSGGALLHVADVPQFSLNIGNSQTGIAHTYSGCFNGQVHVLNALYSVLFTVSPCANLMIVPDPLAPTGQIEGVDCFTTKNFPNGSALTFDGDSECPCGEIVPVQETNWGRVKSLYSK